MELLAFWERYDNDTYFVCSCCRQVACPPTPFCPECKRKMINIKNIEEDRK